MPEQLDIFYDNNPVFQLKPGAGVQRVAWFESEKTLRKKNASFMAWAASFEVD